MKRGFGVIQEELRCFSPQRVAEPRGRVARTHRFGSTRCSSITITGVCKSFFDGCFAACLLLTGMVPTATAQPPVEEPANGSVRIQHLVVEPAELEKRIGDGSTYRPLSRSEYERLLEQTQVLEGSSQGPPQARILEARYRARLVGEDLQQGVAELDIACDTASHVPLTFEPLSIAVGRAQWQAADPPRRAILGADPEGRAVLIVGPQDRSLEFAWSQRGRRISTGLVFSLRFPRANVHSLRVELPEGFTPVTSIGVVDKPVPAEAGYQRWDLHLGAHNELELSILQGPLEAAASSSIRTRQETRYDVSESGVVIQSELELFGTSEGPKSLRLGFDEGIRVLDVSLGNLAVPWTSSAAEDGKVIHVELPNSLPNVSRLTVRALASLDPEGIWQLPRLRPLDVFWESGIARVHVDHPLEIERIQLEDCRITSNDSAVASPDRVGVKRREIELQYFDRDSRAQLWVGPLKDNLRAETAEVVRWSAQEYRLISESDWKLSTGHRFQVRFQVPAGWEVVDVETPDQPTRVQAWNVRSDSGGSKQILELNLARALSAESTLHTRVRARRRNLGANEPFVSHPIPQITPLEVDEQEGVLDFAVVGPYRAYFEKKDGLERFDINQPGERSDKWRGLLPEAPAGTQFYFEDREHEGRVQLIPTMPAASAEVEGFALLGSRELLQHYKLRYAFQDAASDRLLVYFANPTGGQVQWAENAALGTHPEARVLNAQSHAVWRLPPDGELWEVRLPAVRSTIELTARIRSPLGPEATLNLPWPLGDEPAQTLVRVAQEATATWQWDTTGVQALPLAALEAGMPETEASAQIIGAFSYDRPGARISIRPLDPEAIPSEPVIWQAKLESLLARGGHQDHRLTLELNAPQTQFLSFAFSEGQRVRSAWIDGKPTAAAQTGTRLRLPLPKHGSNPVIVVEYESEAQPWSWLRPVTVPLPQIDVPVAAFAWHVAVPHDDEILRIPSRLVRLEPARGHRTWSQRLFGPFGRGKGAARFDPLDAAAWRAVFGQEEKTTGAAAIAERLGVLLQGFPGENRRSDAPILADLLRYLTLPDRGSPPVLVDRIALEEAGWDARRPLAAPQSRRPLGADSARVLLPSYGLTVLATSDAWVLTTVEEAKRLEPWLRGRGVEGVFEVEPSPLAKQIRDAARTLEARPERFQHVFDWTESAASGTPSPFSTSGQTFAERTRGWKVVRMSGMGLPRALKLRLWTQPSAALFATSLFLIAFLAAMATSRLMPGMGYKLNVAAIVLAWSLALVVPEQVSPLFAAAALGVLVYHLGNALRFERSRTNVKELPAKSSLSTIIRPAALGLLLLAVGWVARSAWAQSASPEPETPPGLLQEATAPNAPDAMRLPGLEGSHANEYLVLFPTDGKTDAASNATVYVPVGLLDRLGRHDQGPSQAYVLAGGRYESEMGRQEAMLRVHLDVYAYDRGVPVSVVVPIDPGQLVPGSTRLDGRAVRPFPLHEERGVELTIAEPGLHELEFHLRAPIRNTLDGAQATLRVPPLPQASLEFRSNDRQAPWNAPEARGSMSRGREHRRVAELGALENLTLKKLDLSSEQSVPRVSLRYEMLWDLQPKTVELKAQFHYQVADGSVTELSWLLDSSLEAKRVGPSDLVTSTSLEPLNENFNLLTVSLSSPLTNEIELQAEFNVRDAEGIGHLWLPRLRPRNVQQEDAVMALLENPQINARVTHTEGAAPLAVEAFLDRWKGGPLEQPLDVAYRLHSKATSIALSTRPPQPEKNVVEELLVRPRHERLELVYTARITTNQAPSFQHLIRVSPEITLDEVSITEGDTQRLDHWSRDPQTGTVTLFLAESTTGQQHVQIRGRLPTPLTNALELPCFQSIEGTLASGEILIAPGESWDVVVDNLDRLQPTSASAGVTALAEGDWIAKAYRFDVRDYSAQVRVVPNQRQVNAIQKLSLQRRADAWRLSTEILYQIDQGRVHRFPISLPDSLSWDERNVATPGLRAVAVEDGRNRRIITVVPEQPVEKAFRVRLQGTLSRSATEIPDLRPERVDRIEQYLVFPDGDVPGDGRDREENLQSARLPSELSEGEQVPRSGLTYRVLRPDWRLPLPSGSPGREKGPVVFSADLHVAFDTHGKVWGEAEYTLRLPSDQTVEFRWPQSARLFEVTVDRRPVAGDWSNDETLAIGLSESDFPQRVVLRWNQDLSGRPTSLHQIKLDAPMPRTLPVAKTWWTVRGPNGFRQFETQAAVPSLDLRSLDFERLEQIVLEELSISKALEGRGSDPLRRTLIQPWLRRFDQRLAHVESRLNTSASTESKPRRSLRRLDAILEEQRQWETRFGIETEPTQRTADALLIDAQDRRLPLQPGTTLTYSFANAPASTLEVWNVRQSLLRRTLVGAAGAAILLVGWLFVRRSGFRVAPWNQRLVTSIVGCGIGFAWWWWLEPSVVGFVITAVSLAAAVWAGWRSPSRHDDSVVLVVTR